MKKKIVSIILCTYNCAATLKNTLDSIKKQDYSCIEVVIKDGGSNDGTLEIINDFFKEFQGCLLYTSEEGIFNEICNNTMG